MWHNIAEGNDFLEQASAELGQAQIVIGLGYFKVFRGLKGWIDEKE